MTLKYLVGLSALALADCATVVVKSESIPQLNLERAVVQRVSSDDLNFRDSFTELCMQFGGEYCQPDCALLKAYDKERMKYESMKQ